MKFYIELFSGLLIIFSVLNVIKMEEKMSKEDAMEMMKTLFADCISESGATDEHFKQMMHKEVPTDQEAIDFQCCVLKQLQIIENGEINSKMLKDIISMTVDTETDDEKLKDMTEIAEICSEIKDADEKKLTVRFLECIKDEAEERGIDVE